MKKIKPDTLNGISSAAEVVGQFVSKLIDVGSSLMEVVTETRQEQDKGIPTEENFGGIPLSKLEEMAKNTYRGEGATIENGNLIFESRSRSGKTKGRMLFSLDEAGNLEKPNITYYPGQYRSPAELFFEKLTAELSEKKQ